MATNITTDQQVTLTLVPLSALNKTATLADVPLWSSSNVGSVSLVVAADGMSALAVGGSVGSSTISVLGNAGTDAAPVQITGSLNITVSAAPAAILEITTGTPVLQ